MKKIVLCLLCIPATLFAQAPIGHFMGTICPSCNPFNADGLSLRFYDRVNSPAPLDESASGADVVWNFSGLEQIGNNSYYIETPSAQDIATYPNTTRTMTVWGDGVVTGKVYFTNNGWTFTGVSSNGIDLNYNTDNAALGMPPLSYGYSNNDAVSGTYLYDIYSGTFTGNIVTTVDAYGTLQTYALPEPRPVTRLKTVQTLDINYFPFGNVGTFVQTTYHYYDNNFGFYFWPQFRSTTTTISVPLIGINDTTTTYEMQVQAFLRNPEFNADPIVLWPNPVAETLHLEAPATNAIREISIADVSGKKMLQQKDPSEEINVQTLTTGMYFILIKTDSGQSVRKFIKK